MQEGKNGIDLLVRGRLALATEPRLVKTRVKRNQAGGLMTDRFFLGHQDVKRLCVFQKQLSLASVLCYGQGHFEKLWITTQTTLVIIIKNDRVCRRCQIIVDQ